MASSTLFRSRSASIASDTTGWEYGSDFAVAVPYSRFHYFFGLKFSGPFSRSYDFFSKMINSAHTLRNIIGLSPGFLRISMVTQLKQKFGCKNDDMVSINSTSKIESKMT